MDGPAIEDKKIMATCFPIEEEEGGQKSFPLARHLVPLLRDKSLLPTLCLPKKMWRLVEGTYRNLKLGNEYRVHWYSLLTILKNVMKNTDALKLW